MGENMPHVNFFPVVVDRCDESRLISSNVENRELPNLVGVGENRSPLLNNREICASHPLIPLKQARCTIRVDFSKIVQPFTRDDMHGRGSRGRYLKG